MGRQMTMSQLVAVRGAVDIEIEAIFAHGALCISYSGQCFDE